MAALEVFSSILAAEYIEVDPDLLELGYKSQYFRGPARQIATPEIESNVQRAPRSRAGIDACRFHSRNVSMFAGNGNPNPRSSGPLKVEWQLLGSRCPCAAVNIMACL